MIPSTDPIPYIVFAYSVGLGSIFGYIAYCLYQNRKLSQLLETIEKNRE